MLLILLFYKAFQKSIYLNESVLEIKQNKNSCMSLSAVDTD